MAARKTRKTVKKTSSRKTPVKKAPATRRKNPVRKLTRYVVRIEATGNRVGYLSDWSKAGPSFDSDPSKAIKGGDRKLMWQFANAVADKKPRGVKSVDVVILGTPEKKN